MKRSFLPLVGVALFGFVIGACVQHTASPQGGLDRAAQAQGAAPIRNTADLASLSATYAQISRKVTPAVVNIQSTSIIPGRVMRDPFSDFFGGDMGGHMLKEPDRKSQSLGSGVLIDPRGYIITNNHVVKNATQVVVTLSDRRRFPAKILGADADTDVAMLKIEGTDLPTLKWADSEKLNVGDIVLAVGSPFNLASTVTQGIISAKGRHDLGITAYEDFLQTDAAINPGNSGGALVDINGDLVGINSAILSESGGNQGIGLAIPSSLAKKIGAQLTATGKVTRGWLGIVVQPLTDDISEQIGLKDGGVIVTGVYDNGPAAAFNWTQNGTDILLSVNGTQLDSPGQLRNIIAGSAPGANLKLKVWQNGKIVEFDTQLTRRPDRVQGV